jgi:hypothetical protein
MPNFEQMTAGQSLQNAQKSRPMQGRKDAKEKMPRWGSDSAVSQRETQARKQAYLC